MKTSRPAVCTNILLFSGYRRSCRDYSGRCVRLTTCLSPVSCTAVAPLASRKALPFCNSKFFNFRLEFKNEDWKNHEFYGLTIVIVTGLIRQISLLFIVLIVGWV